MHNMDIKLGSANQYNHMCSGENGVYTFEKQGGGVFFKLNEKIPADCEYFMFDIDNKQDFSVRIDIRFYKDKSGDPKEWLKEKHDFCITTGILPFIKTSVEIPLSYFDGQTLFGKRRKGILKTVVNGKRMNISAYLWRVVMSIRHSE